MEWDNTAMDKNTKYGDFLSCLTMKYPQEPTHTCVRVRDPKVYGILSNALFPIGLSDYCI
jgi:hypothetical protein